MAKTFETVEQYRKAYQDAKAAYDAAHKSLWALSKDDPKMPEAQAATQASYEAMQDTRACRVICPKTGFDLTPATPESIYLDIQSQPVTNEVLKNHSLYVNIHVGSDTTPYEVIEATASGKTITIREMNVGPQKANLDFHVGGFVAHCSNQHAQEYDYTSNPYGCIRILKITKNGVGGKAPIEIALAPRKFYDYNF